MAKLFNEQEKQRLNFASSVKVAQLIFKAQMNKGWKFLKKLWCSDEGLTLETSAYGGQFTFLT